jgi:nucleoside-diphosphate-sugar epimerase
VITGNVLITGAGGFIGNELARYFSAAGLNVVGIDVHFDREDAGFQAITADYADTEKYIKQIPDAPVVYHLASAHLDVRLDEKQYWKTNVDDIPEFIRTVADAGARRFVHVSSVGVYGHLNDIPADENTVCSPQSIYGVTKLASEKVVKETCEKYGMEYVIIRPAWVYGATCPRTRKLIRMLKKNRFFWIGDGSNMRHPVFIDDMLHALDLAGQSDNCVGEMFIVGGNHAINSKELVHEICKTFGYPFPKLTIPFSIAEPMAWVIERIALLFGVSPPVSTRTLEFFKTNNAFNIEKARKLLGFNPAFDLNKGMARIKADIN